jgi:hypothetical protein
VTSRSRRKRPGVPARSKGGRSLREADGDRVRHESKKTCAGVKGKEVGKEKKPWWKTWRAWSVTAVGTVVVSVAGSTASSVSGPWAVHMLSPQPSAVSAGTVDSGGSGSQKNSGLLELGLSDSGAADWAKSYCEEAVAAGSFCMAADLDGAGPAGAFEIELSNAATDDNGMFMPLYRHTESVSNQTATTWCVYAQPDYEGSAWQVPPGARGNLPEDVAETIESAHPCS